MFSQGCLRGLRTQAQTDRMWDPGGYFALALDVGQRALTGTVIRKTKKELLRNGSPALLLCSVVSWMCLGLLSSLASRLVCPGGLACPFVSYSLLARWLLVRLLALWLGCLAIWHCRKCMKKRGRSTPWSHRSHTSRCCSRSIERRMHFEMI